LARGLLGQQSIYFLVSKQAHLRQYTIRAPLARVFSSKSFLGALFVGICPVEDLFFDELVCGQRPEWCAGEVELGFGRDREEFDLLFRKHCEVFVHILEVGTYLSSFFATASSSPSNSSFAVSRHAEVVFVKYHEVQSRQASALCTWCFGK
jgi:hypothetical protein